MSLEHMLQDEQEAWRFLLEEAARQGEFGMTLQEIEAALQARIDYMGKFDESPWNEWLDCYKAVAQVKQAIAAEKQNELLLRIAIGVECLENVGH